MSATTTYPAPTEGAGNTDFWSATRLVAEREINAQVRTKGFWITFAVFIVGIFGSAIVPSLFGGGATTVATVGPEAEQIIAVGDFEIVPATDQAEAEELLRAGEVDAAVVPDQAGSSPVGVRVIGLSNTPDDVVAALSVAPEVDILDPDEVPDELQFLMAFLFALVFFMFSVGFGMAIAQSVVTEKQTRIVEILVATVPVRALLTGKIVGFSLLVFAQVAVLGLVTPVALRLGGQSELLTNLSPVLAWFVPYFILGFVLLASMWAVAGSIVSRQEDLGSSTSLVMALVMLPYFGVVFGRESDLVMTILSYVPFSSPVAMPVRMFSGDAQTWEPLVSMAILVGTLVVVVVVASRLYSGSLLQTGSRVKLGKAWSRAD